MGVKCRSVEFFPLTSWRCWETRHPLMALDSSFAQVSWAGALLRGSNFSHKSEIFTVCRSKLHFQVSLIPMSYGWPQELLNPSL